MRAGTVKAVMAGMNTMVMPDTMPGTDRGSTTRRKVTTLLAPRSRAASRRDLSSFARVLYRGMIMNGRKL